MEHIAIMRKSLGMIGKILSGEKTIESRWYKTRRAPWDRIEKGDTVYFKDSGEPVTAKARVSGVLQFEGKDAREILERYGKGICIGPKSEFLVSGKRYCILVSLESPEKVKQFKIDKTGFGISSAWLTVNDIGKLRI